MPINTICCIHAGVNLRTMERDRCSVENGRPLTAKHVQMKHASSQRRRCSAHGAEHNGSQWASALCRNLAGFSRGEKPARGKIVRFSGRPVAETTKERLLNPLMNKRAEATERIRSNDKV